MVILLCFSTKEVHTQPDTIFLRGRFDDHGLKLRWSCANLDVLKAGLINGYKVDIFQVVNGREILSKSLTAQMATETTISSAIFNQTDSAAYGVAQEVLAQSNFFSDEDERQWKLLSLLFGLQDNFELTKALAMGTEIEEIDQSLTYRCKIRINSANGFQNSISEILDIKYPAIDILPAPEKLNIICRMNRVTLSGTMLSSADYYSSYRIDRDTFVGNEFEPINDVPLIVNYAEGPPQIYMIDTIIESRPTRYRVQGKDIWGNWGPFSDTVFVDPCHINMLPPQPFQSFEIEDRGAIEMWWNVPDSLHAFLMGFEIYRAENKFDNYIKISDLIPPDQFNYRDDEPNAVNYYYVEAIYQGDIRRRSLSDVATLIDTEPPSAPTNVQVNFDTTTFVATITWDEITGNDFSGYRILYNSKGEGHQKFLLYNLELSQTIFRDSINSEILQEDRYYWITARDFSGNESVFSEAVNIDLPDRFPPTPARITDVKSDFSHTEVYWVRSPSRDVTDYVLQKKIKGDIEWQNIVIEDGGGENIYLDSLLTPGDTTLYRIVAEDANGLQSESNMRSALRLPEVFLPEIQLINIVAGDSTTAIIFDYPETTALKYFRLMGGPTMDEMRTIAYIVPSQAITRNGLTKQGIDDPFSLYQYAIGDRLPSPYFFKISAVGSDGRVSKFSEVRQL